MIVRVTVSTDFRMTNFKSLDARPPNEVPQATETLKRGGNHLLLAPGALLQLQKIDPGPRHWNSRMSTKSVNPYRRRVLYEMHALLKRVLDPSDRVLEVGAGDGWFAMSIEDMGICRSQVMAIDAQIERQLHLDVGIGWKRYY